MAKKDTFLPKPGRIKRAREAFVRLVLYAVKGFGKSYFADRWPDVFVINTDGNLPYYTSPGLIVNNWEAKDRPKGMSDEEWMDLQKRSFVNVVDELVATKGNGFKTIVIDLIEGVYALARTTKLIEYGLKHEKDAGGFGVGYQIIRDPFYAAIKKLYSLPLNIILLSHEVIEQRKDRIGRESDYYTANLSEKVLDEIAGTGYTLRAYWKGSLEEGNDTPKAVRMLSLSPKDDELHVARLVDTDGNAIELDDIELDYDKFIETFAAINDPEKAGTFKTAQVDTGITAKAAKKPRKPRVTKKDKEEKKEPEVETPVTEEVKEEKKKRIPKKPTKVEKEEPVAEEPKEEAAPEVEEPEVVEEVKEEPKEEVKKTTKKRIPKKPTGEKKETKTETTNDTPAPSIDDEKKARIEALKKKYLDKGAKK